MPYSHILIMKAGPYCGYSLPEIIKIKQKEQRNCGRFFWGYSGVFCRPNAIAGFVSHARQAKQTIKVLFVETKSSYAPSEFGRFTHFGASLSQWQRLPKQVLLVGNKNVLHFAIVARNLKPENFELNLGDYCSFSGMFTNKNKYLDKYFRGRVDKACGLYWPKENTVKQLVKVSYTAELAEPYCVYIMDSASSP